MDGQKTADIRRQAYTGLGQFPCQYEAMDRETVGVAQQKTPGQFEAMDEAVGVAEQQAPMALYQTPGQFDANGNGFYCRQETTPELVAKLRNIEVFEDDIFLVSYPKTGTTLVSETLFLVCDDAAREPVRRKPIWERVLHLDAEDSFAQLELQSRPRLMQTHFLFEMFPIQAIEKKAKVIYVLRNPKDTLVSFYHFYQSYKSLGNFTGSWNDFFQLFLNKKLIYGDFYTHVLSWWHQRHRDNILFLKYEDMVTDPKSNILKSAPSSVKLCLPIKSIISQSRRVLKV